MNYRKIVLKRLLDFYEKEGPPPAFLSLDPIVIIGIPVNKDYADAINRLISEGIIVGVSASDNKPAFTLNPEKIDTVRKILRPLWKNPTFQWLVGILIAVAALLWAIIEFYLRK